MKIRPGRTRSLIGGIAALLVMVVGLVMMSSFGGLGIIPTPFVALWIILGLLGAALSFYNAISRQGLPLYEVNMEDEGERFCPQCGKPVQAEDQFCRHCGVRLD